MRFMQRSTGGGLLRSVAVLSMLSMPRCYLLSLPSLLSSCRECESGPTYIIVHTDSLVLPSVVRQSAARVGGRRVAASNHVARAGASVPILPCRLPNANRGYYNLSVFPMQYCHYRCSTTNSGEAANDNKDKAQSIP